ncbi:MAG: class I SAM-dependent methyltransferase [Methanothrix sp.]|nr:class I SAM-dependent methyltransferase [Methanothrix sp.]
MMSEDSTVSCYDEHARMYDVYQSSVVPHYRDMLDMVAKACERYLKPNALIIDLGCGTGNASLAVQEKLSARIFLIDGSKEMMDIAQSKIDKAAQAGYRVADISREGWDEGLGNAEYDAVISTLVLEHLPFDRYRSVIEKCFRLLQPGGWLIATEGYAEEGSDMQEWFYEEMEDQRRGLDPKLSDFVAGLRVEKEVHYYCSKAKKAEWWKEAGFSQVNVLWQYLGIALMVGRRPLLDSSSGKQV